MKYIKKNLVLMIAGLVLSLSAASAMAATIDAGVGLYATNNDVSIPFQNARLAQFDSSLGTLSGVSLILEGTYSSVLTAVNNGSSLSTPAFAAWTIEPYSMEIGNLSLSVSAKDGIEPNWFAPLGVPGGESSIVQSPVLSVLETYTFDEEDRLNAFTGPGFIDFYFGSASHSVITKIVGNVSTSFKTVFTGSIKATYNYTAAPLPSALLFLLSGLAGITGFRKFRGRASV